MEVIGFTLHDVCINGPRGPEKHKKTSLAVTEKRTSVRLCVALFQIPLQVPRKRGQEAMRLSLMKPKKEACPFRSSSFPGHRREREREREWIVQRTANIGEKSKCWGRREVVSREKADESTSLGGGVGGGVLQSTTMSDFVRQVATIMNMRRR